MNLDDTDIDKPEQPGQIIDPQPDAFTALAFSMVSWCTAEGTGGSGPM